LKVARDQRLSTCVSGVVNKDDGLIKYRCGEFSQPEIDAAVEITRVRAEAELASRQRYP
jgi:hypothetical protein